MKQKPKTKLVHIGWASRHERATPCFSSLFPNQRDAQNTGSLYAGYIDTVRVFAEVPVGKGGKEGS